MKTHKYFQFPLFLMRDYHINRSEALNNIINYGLYAFNQKNINITHEQIAKQLMYEYYRGDITQYLAETIQSYANNGNLLLDDNYYGFSGDTFIAEQEIEDLLQIWKTDIDFYNEAKAMYVMNFFKVTGNYKTIFETGETIFNKITKGEPMPMINKDVLFDFRDNEKTEFESMLFACYIGIRSIIGKKSYCKTNKQMILCRAFGYSSNKNLPEQMPELYYKYSKRYHIDKILKSIELNTWNLHFYSSQMRGLYVGIKNKISLETMVLNAEANKQKNKIQQLKREKEIARQKALQHLNKEPHLNKEYKMN